MIRFAVEFLNPRTSGWQKNQHRLLVLRLWCSDYHNIIYLYTFLPPDGASRGPHASFLAFRVLVMCWLCQNQEQISGHPPTYPRPRTPGAFTVFGGRNVRFKDRKLCLDLDCFQTRSMSIYIFLLLIFFNIFIFVLFISLEEVFLRNSMRSKTVKKSTSRPP